jgi:hypothetical protein
MNIGTLPAAFFLGSVSRTKESPGINSMNQWKRNAKKTDRLGKKEDRINPIQN